MSTPDVPKAGDDTPLPASRPAESAVPSALPGIGPRLLAFLAIVIAGVCGALIGYAFTDLQCTGDCNTWRGLGTIIGAVTAAAGVTVVVVLALRAMDEWKTIEASKAENRK